MTRKVRLTALVLVGGMTILASPLAAQVKSEPVPESDTKVLAQSPKDPLKNRAAGNFGHTYTVRSGRGLIRLRIDVPDITVNSDVVASIGEMTEGDAPFIGAAHMSVLNVAPFDGGVWVRLHIASDQPLRYQVMLLYSR